MRLLTWNVNSIKTLRYYHPWCDFKTFKQVLDTLDADIICFQEVKLARDKLDKDLAIVEGYDAYFSFSQARKGYSGVATFIRKSSGYVPLATSDDLAAKMQPSSSVASTYIDSCDALNNHFSNERLKELGQEGRCVMTDHGVFVLINVYCPNETGPERIDFKMDYYRALEVRTKELLESGRQVVIAGDINLCHKIIDHCDPLKSIREHNLTSFDDHEPRKWFTKFTTPNGSMTDLFRRFQPDEKGAYTCWNTLINARPANYGTCLFFSSLNVEGTRIDYILVSDGLLDLFTSCIHSPEIMGSDHCPVIAETLPSDSEIFQAKYNLLLPDPTIEPAPLATIYYPEFSNRQKKLFDFFQKVEKSSVNINKPKTESTQVLIKEVKKPKLDKAKKSTDASQPSIMSFISRKNEPTNSQNKMIPEPVDDSSTILCGPDELEDISQLEQKFQEADAKREAWSNLPFGKPPAAPKCHHNQECKEFTVNKKGPNKGRRFYLCARPVGPDHSTERGKKGLTDYRCDFFQWKKGPATTKKRSLDEDGS